MIIFFFFFSSSVSQAIQSINEAVDNKDSSQTLAALRSPAAGLYGVTSECAQTYQDDLFRIKEDKKKEGEMGSCVDSLIFGTKIYSNIYRKTSTISFFLLKFSGE